MSKKQVYNPYLPLNEYIPDGEPHVFGDRVYIYGSHDKEDGETFCMLDYVTWSAPVTDLSDWRYDGVIYKASQDPDYNERPYMYAPDVVKGNDGKYYLYYCMSGKDGVGGYFGPISVAVSESPAGPFEYIGFVRNPDGTPMKDYVCFDPGVLNDNGVIRVYYGTRYEFEESTDFGPVNACGELLDAGSFDDGKDGREKSGSGKALSPSEKSELGLQAFLKNEALIQQEMNMFGKSREEIVSMAKKDSVMSPAVVVLEDDMLTVKEPAKHIIPYRVFGTSFETHPFFEASSMRKVGDKYYFIYSSRQNHELCYATSDYPDRDFVFGGTIVSNGDIGMNGRMDDKKLNMTGTTHGSIIEINGEWYVFFHRLTHKSDYSRQSCAEKIEILPDGSIKQVPYTSCGLNGGPLAGKGVYPAPICCALTNGAVPHGCNRKFKDHFPNVSSGNGNNYVSEITDGTLIGYRYFNFAGKTTLKLRISKSIRYYHEDGIERKLSEEEKKNLSKDGYFEIFQTILGTGFETEEEKKSEAMKGFESDDCKPFRLEVKAEFFSGEDAYEWQEISVECDLRKGVYPLYFKYHGGVVLDLLEFELV